MARDARPSADAPPARRGVALKHLLRRPGRVDRARLGATAAGVPRGAHLRATRDDRHRLPRPLGEAQPAAAVPWARFRADRRRPLDGAADLPVGRRRPCLDARRLAPLRAHAARRRRRAPIASVGALDDDGPPDAGAAAGVDVVPRGSRLGLRRRRHNRRPLRPLCGARVGSSARLLAAVPVGCRLPSAAPAVPRRVHESPAVRAAVRTPARRCIPPRRRGRPRRRCCLRRRRRASRGAS